MSGPPIHGFAAPGFEPVREAFAANFGREAAYREVGASLTVYRRGECLVDLWGGHADRAGTKEWRRDTLVNLWSTTKAVAAMCVALLVERGALDYGQRVATIWPEFAAAGKEEVTLAEVLSHQAGLPGFAAPTGIEDLYDQQLCAARLAAQAPLWEPGTANGYHAVTYGLLVAEIVRRADGRPIGQFLAEELAGPLKADFHIGLPAALESEVAETIPPDRPADLGAIEMNPATVMALASPSMDAARANDKAWRAAEMPALNGHGSAQGIARLYAGLIGGAFLSETVLDAMTAVAADRPDLVIGINPKWGMGIAHNESGMFGPEPATFGHSGWGGSFGCAHRPSGIAIGYALNHMGPELVGDPRATGLCGAIFKCLESVEA